MMRMLISLFLSCLAIFRPLSAEESLPSRFSHVKLSEGSSIGRIYIGSKNEMISQSTYIYVKAAYDHFVETKPACIILELDTPGGEVFAAEKISDLLKSLDFDHGIPVVAYINNWAISAGAMLAYSCRYIVTAPDGSMGAAAPIVMTEEGVEPAQEKMVSALRADFANKAALFGRNRAIAEAMVDADLILVERGGAVVSEAREEDAVRGETLILRRGKLLTLTASEMERYGLAVAVASPISSDVPNRVKESFLARLDPFMNFPDSPIDTFEMGYKTSLLAFLASPYVSSLLVFILMVSIYLELSSPGVTLPGAVAALCLFFIIVSRNAQEAIAWFEPIVVLLGVMLIVIEVALFPTMGLLLGLGICVTLVGGILMVAPAIKGLFVQSGTYSFAVEYSIHLLFLMSVAVLLALAVIYMLIRKNKKPMFLAKWHMVLDAPPPPAPRMEDAGFEKPIFVGDGARVCATLRPSGTIEKDSVIYDALSRGEFIEAGEQVVVVEIRGSMIFVERRL